MIEYRCFRNTDPPHLLSVWREQPPARGLMQPISNMLLEMFVLSKPYFDRQGLIVAAVQDEVVGFIHAGFGPDETGDQLSRDVGITCILAARPGENRAEVLAGLIERSETYLRSHGATELRVGGNYPMCPFYLGLCGGSDLPGVLSTDDEMDQFYQSHGYQSNQQCIVFDRDLQRYRVPVDRQLMQHRRKYGLLPQVNPTDVPWWDACVFGPTDRIRFYLRAKDEEKPCGEITYWDMGPLSTRPQANGMGMINVSIREDCRGQGLGTFLVAESLRQLQTSGINRVEAQTTIDNEPLLKILKKLDFMQIRRGVLYVK